MIQYIGVAEVKSYIIKKIDTDLVLPTTEEPMELYKNVFIYQAAIFLVFKLQKLFCDFCVLCQQFGNQHGFILKAEFMIQSHTGKLCKS